MRFTLQIAIRPFVALLAALLLFSGCKSTDEKKDDYKTKTYHGVSFEIAPPEDAKVSNKSGEDYAVHYVQLKGSKAAFGIYEGHRPRLFSKKERNLTLMRRGTTARGNIENGDDAWGVDSNGKIWRESVWHAVRPVKIKGKKNSFDLPVSLHIWYFGVDEEEAEMFDRIISTIEVTH